ncbi:MAG TPA: hypothetical protein VIY69_14410 [Candidatus Acidoferrales bacterium]
MTNEQRDQLKSAPAKYLAQTLFVIWVVVVNVLYYLQFKSLFLARFASLVHR